MNIGLLHPGNMGAPIGSQLVAHGNTVFWHSTGRSDATRERAEQAGLRAVKLLPQLLDRAQIVLSICPAAAATDVAELVASHRYRGLFVDCNAISPVRMRRVAETVRNAGGKTVDAIIAGPPPTPNHTTRVYLAGEPREAGVVQDLLGDSGISATVLSEQIGSASALKMALTSYLRTTRLLTAIAHGLADDHGVTDALITEARMQGHPVLADRDYLSSVAARAWRWEPEMREVAATLTDSQLPTNLAVASAELYRCLAPERDRWTIPPQDVVALLRSHRRA